MDLAEFLTARYDEFEQLAIGAAIQVDGKLSDWFVWNPESQDMTIAQTTASGASEKIVWADESQGRHVLAWHPRFTLADLAAKRRILARHKPVKHHRHALGAQACEGCGNDLRDGTYLRDIDECPELRDLAAPYADHPDFDPAWAVSA